MSEVNHDRLMAYADGQLTPDDRRAVETYLSQHPEAAAEVGAIQRQTDGIRTLFGPAGAEPVPARLRARRIATEINRGRSRALGWAVAAMLVLGTGLGIGWFARPVFDGVDASQVLIADAVNAHTVFVAENRHAVEVGSDDSEHLSNWLSNRLATPLGLPDLSSEGFSLVGGRLLPGEPDAGGRAAQLMFENGAQQRVTVYVTAALPDGATAYEFATRNGAEAFYWANGRITCTVVGSLPEGQMKLVSQAVYHQLGSTSARPDYRG